MENAQDKLETHDYVLFDGDIFQPLWYNWAYDFKLFNQPLELMTEFYRKHIVSGEIGFPNKYILLSIDEMEQVELEILNK